MILQRIIVLGSLLTVAVVPVHARVVINEIFYHAPNDLDDLQFIEVHNSGDQVVDLSGWKLTKGIRFQFPPETKIAAQGYLVLCRNQERFKEFYSSAANGSFDQSLSHNGAPIELVNARGKKIDSVKYQSRAPWPVSPHGYS